LRGIVDAARRAHAGFGLVVLLIVFASAAPAASDDAVRASASAELVVKRGDRGSAVRQIQSRLGIPADGVFGPQTERAVRRFQRANGLVADGIVGPLTRRALGLESFNSAGGSVRSILEAIAVCESGGNPRAVAPGGQHRGKYQFTRATWKRLGGSGDPARAPEWLQDRLAMKLYRQSGDAPWPNCR
jgi:Transglycosylase-like domain/Putative peptidoglycan binding domain